MAEAKAMAKCLRADALVIAETQTNEAVSFMERGAVELVHVVREKIYTRDLPTKDEADAVVRAILMLAAAMALEEE